MPGRHRILIVDDDAATRDALRAGLAEEGFGVVTAASGEEALPVALRGAFDAVVTDVVMDGMDGIALLRTLHAARPALPVVVVTGYGDVESAVAAMRAGAVDYLAKPVGLARLTHALRRVLGATETEPAQATPAPRILGESEAIRRVLRTVAAVGPTDATVLARGESGTGKELVAQALHAASPRRAQPVVAVNCAAIAETLAESELFGHEKGAFTGALRTRKGKVELADGGTLFLDEVGELSPAVQTKLLRMLQERVVERVGGTRSFPVDVRVVAATNRDLLREANEGRFRLDLFYRLRVVEVVLPPLRERVEDVPLLARHFLSRFAHRYYRADAPALGRGVAEALQAHPWPGNVRELANVMEELVVLGGPGRDHVTLADLPAHIRARRAVLVPLEEDKLLDGSRSLAEIERLALHRTLARTGGNRTAAARVLGIGLKTLYRKLKEE